MKPEEAYRRATEQAEDAAHVARDSDTEFFRSIYAQKAEMLVSLLDQINDARSLVAEVAQGVTHWAGCTPELRCVRCERDEARALLAEAQGVRP